MYVNKAEIFKFKVNDNIRRYSFCLTSESKDFTKDDQSSISLNGTLYDFPFDHSSIEKGGKLNIDEYLMIRNNIKWCLGLSKKSLLDY